MNETDSELLEKKWEKLLKLSSLFNFIPFLDFVFVAGSLALKRVHENSDFDVILGAKPGRIFTVRFFCFLLFGLVGARRKSSDGKEAAKNKFCFNHFVTPESYVLEPPYNDYWRKLYENLAPLWGDKEKMEIFLKANSELMKNPNHNWSRFRKSGFNFSRFKIEFFLKGAFGNRVEVFLKRTQIKKIERGLKFYVPGSYYRLRYDDKELAFHPEKKSL